MKQIAKILAAATVAVIIALVSTVSAHAKTVEQSYIDSYKGKNVPAPIEVVTPLVGGEFINTRVEAILTVDETGAVKEVQYDKGVSEALKADLTPALTHWKFTPEVKDGKPVAFKAILPVVID